MIFEHKFIKLNDGVELHAEIKEKGHKGWFIAVHGIGEHLGRHQYIQDLFGHQFNILQFDLRGHGRSQGEKAYIDRFEQYIEDLSEVIEFLKDEYSMQNYILFGHSMGALICASFLQYFSLKNLEGKKVELTSLYPDRCFLSAPPVGFGGRLGDAVNFIPKEFFESVMTRLPISLELPGFVNLDNLSHKANVKIDYLEDELNCQRLHTKLVFELVRWSKTVFSLPIRPSCPVACAVGGDDSIVSPKRCQEYFQNIEKGVSFKLIEGAFHEMHNEVNKYKGPYFDFLKASVLD